MNTITRSITDSINVPFLKTPERVLPPQIATQHLADFFKRHNFEFEFQELGNQIKTFVCHVSHPLYSTTTGYGKGKTWAQSMASALFEALEHYVSQGRLVDTSNTKTLTIKKALDTYKCFPLECLQKKKDATEELLWDIFESLNTKEVLFVPSCLIDLPGGTRTFGKRIDLEGTYSNSGTATGSNFEEAVLHSINELIERDAYSLLLLETFCRAVPRNLRVIDKNSLPKQLQKLLLECEQEINTTVTLLNITSDLNVPSIACFTERKNTTDELIIGFGCSPSAEYAVERALLENVQGWYVHHKLNISHSKDQEKISHLCNELPKLKECLRQDYQKKIEEDFVERIDFKSLAQMSLHFFDIDETNFLPSKVLPKILEILQHNSMNVYVKTFFEDPTKNLVCIKSVIPELEVFNLVTSGLLPLPKQRGKNAILLNT